LCFGSPHSRIHTRKAIERERILNRKEVHFFEPECGGSTFPRWRHASSLSNVVCMRSRAWGGDHCVHSQAGAAADPRPSRASLDDRDSKLDPSSPSVWYPEALYCSCTSWSVLHNKLDEHTQLLVNHTRAPMPQTSWGYWDRKGGPCCFLGPSRIAQETALCNDDLPKGETIVRHISRGQVRPSSWYQTLGYTTATRLCRKLASVDQHE
jgi:hypothetical protein